MRKCQLLRQVYINALAFSAHSVIVKKMMRCEYDIKGRVHNTSFSTSLMKEPNTLECLNLYIFSSLE